MRKKWSTDSVIKAIRELHEATNDISPTNARKTNPSLYIVARRFYGSWELAVKEAGFDPSLSFRKKPKWTDDEIRNEIASIYRKSRTLSEKYFRENHANLISVAQNRFGGWYKALNKLGFPTDEVKTRWDKQTVINKIEFIHNSGGSLSQTDVDNSLYLAATRRFSSWDNALISSGIDPKKHRKYEKWTKQDMLDRILTYYKDGLNMSNSSIYQIDSALASSYTMFFDSWNELLHEAGVPLFGISNNTSKCSAGFRFQYALKTALYAIGEKFEYEKSQSNSLRPDFILPDGSWLDAKLSSWTALRDGTISKYTPHTPHLIIVYLRGNDVKPVDKNITFLSVKEFYPSLIKVGRRDIIQLFKEIQNEVSLIEDIAR